MATSALEEHHQFGRHSSMKIGIVGTAMIGATLAQRLAGRRWRQIRQDTGLDWATHIPSARRWRP
jgi:phosphoglycerate dehydrogenase-like enzyme